MTDLDSFPLEDGKSLEELSLPEISRVIVKVQRMRHAKVTELVSLNTALAKAIKDSEIAHARAFLAHDGPQEERTQVAKLAAADAKFRAEVARGRLNACKASMDVLKDDWDSCRSIGANERADAQLAGTGMP